MTSTDNALELTGLSVRLANGDTIVEDVDLSLAAGEILGVVGESGSGKTTTALSLLGYATPGAVITGGRLKVGGKTLNMDDSMRPMRGSAISYVPQDPSRSLNPALRIGASIRDVIDAHRSGSTAKDALAALEQVGLPGTDEAARRFPHQMSGGQQQRVTIAMALSCQPGVVVLDEPTTGLDVVTQARILDELRRLRADRGISMVYVTHDLAVVAQIADRVAVMYAGRVVEEGATEAVMRQPRHPYTRGLLSSIPDHVRPRVLEPMPGIPLGVGERVGGCAFAARCTQVTDACVSALPPLSQLSDRQSVRCLHHADTLPVASRSVDLSERARRPPVDPILVVEGLAAGHRSGTGVTVAAEDVNFTVAPGECVALVGESGSGKTTIARTIAGLHPLASGRMVLHGEELRSTVGRRSREQRRQIQIVFQNPASALNPQHTVSDAIARPAQVLRKMNRADVATEVNRLLERVRLPARLASRYPNELSGGEKQRVAIARALAAAPEIILCDEITSALDVSVQAAVLELLNELRQELGLSLLFITHDLGVVATVADRVLVLDRGRICDDDFTDVVLREPTADYTRRLLEAAPSISAAVTEPNGPTIAA
jgi:peptide/nickel transport system ATP-binding protein